TGNAKGLFAFPKAVSTTEVASTAKVLIGGGTTQITSVGPVDIFAGHDQFNPSLNAYASWNTAHTPDAESKPNTSNLYSTIEADAGATVVAGPPADSTKALTVQAVDGSTGPITSTTTHATMQWDANVTIAAGASPTLIVNSDGTIAKAVAVTVDDSAGGGPSERTSGQIQSDTVVVNAVNDPGSEVDFSAANGITNSAN